MSLAMRYAKGDPGLFDVIGKVVKGVGGLVGAVIPGVGAVTSFVGGALSGIDGKKVGASGVSSNPIRYTTDGRAFQMGSDGKNHFVDVSSGSSSLSLASIAKQMPILKSAPMGSLPMLPIPDSVITTSGAGINFATPSASAGTTQTAYYSPAAGIAGACQRGFHVAKDGSRCVKNRRMNPLNPRAASKAVRRLAGFQRATSAVEKQLRKMAGKAVRGSRAPARFASKKGCGCK